MPQNININTGKLRSTSVTGGAGVTINTGDNTKFDVDVQGYIVDPVTGVKTDVTVTQAGISPAFMGSQNETYVLVDITGAVVQQSTPPTLDQLSTHLTHWVVVHIGGVIDIINELEWNSEQLGDQFSQLCNILEPLKKGLDITEGTTGLRLTREEGRIFRIGIGDTPTNKSTKDFPTASDLSFQYRTSDGTQYSVTQDIDNQQFESSPGVLSTVSTASTVTAQPLYIFPSGNIVAQYGQYEYATMQDAIEGVVKDDFIKEGNIERNGVLLGWVVTKKTASDWSNSDDYVIVSTNNPDVQANSSARHTHSNKALLDSYDQSNADIVSAIDHSGLTTGNPHNVNKSDVGLGNVDNTSDNDKPISTATQSALDDKADTTALNSHINDTNNPHDVNKTDVGLDNVDNTSDLDKPISTSTQDALDLKTDNLDFNNHLSDTNNPHQVDKADVGLANADNTSDLDKPISTDTQDALDDKADSTDLANYILLSEKGSNNGVAELDNGGKVPASQLPSFVDDVLEFDDNSLFPSTGETGKIYIALDSNKTYRWSGTNYVEISSSLALGETSSTAYRGDRGKIAYDHSQETSGNPHNVTKSDVGLSNVNNTSDLDKPISTDTQDALDDKASNSDLSLHTGDLTNPHSVTKSQVGLGNVDNTSDLDKPISTATQSALDDKADDADLSTHISDQLNPHDVTKSQVGLGNVDDTSDNDKPISTATQTALDLKADDADLDSHITDLNNPHQVTKADVGLENADNTSDLDKPVSTATQTALGLKADNTTVDAHINDTNNPHGVTKSDVGLENVENTADHDKPISSATQDALDDKADSTDLDNYIPLTEKGANSGVAELNSSGKVPASQLPSFVDDVLEFDDNSLFPANGESGKIYIASDTNKVYRWSGTNYVEISSSLALGETSSTAYRGDRGKIAYDHSQETSGNPHNVTKSDVGLGNVDNTSDLDKPISTATQGALDSKASDSDLTSHTSSQSNPHSVTKTQVGLGNVDNTSDLDKPISTDTQDALDLKTDNLDFNNHLNDDNNPHNVNKTDVGLGNVNNTSDLDKPVSTATQSALDLKADESDFTDHTSDQLNPHNVTKTQVGLGNVDNTSDLNKPISTDTQDALDDKTDNTDFTDHTSDQLNPHNVTKTQVGLSNVDNTSDLDKPISTDTQDALDDKADSTDLANYIPNSEKGSNNGVAELDNTGKIPASQLPAFVDEVQEYADLASFPTTGDSGKIYIALDTNITYRWSGTAYVEISSSLALGETDTTAYRGDKGKIAYDHSQLTTGNPHNVTKGQVGLGNVDNTSDLAKPISTATQGALDLKSDATHDHDTDYAPLSHVTDTANPHSVTKAQVGLSNVDNTSDLDKPISTDTQNALDDKANDLDLTNHINDTNNPHGVTKSDVGINSTDDIPEGSSNLYFTNARVSDNSEVQANSSSRHSHSNKSLLDTYNQSNADITVAINHTGLTIGNPHNVTKSQVGLGNVNNTSDLDKPISTDTQNALDDKADTTTLNSHIDDDNNPHDVTKTQVGLGNVDNTSDLDKPISTATQDALDDKQDTLVSGSNIKTIDGQSLLGTGDIPIPPGLSLGETSSTAYRGDRGKTAYDHSQLTSGNPHNVTKTQVGLGNVDNTSDIDKPISTATQSALDDKADDLDLTNHINDTNNPHGVTKSQVGLGNVDNTSDLSKPISTATQNALDDKADTTTLNTHINDDNNPHGVTKAQVGLSNVDNTSDLSKPISTDTQSALDDKADSTDLANYILLSEKGSNNGVAELDNGGKVPASQLPSYVSDVIEVNDYSSLPTNGESGNIYITIDNDKVYRWTGTGYAEIGDGDLQLGITSETAYRGDRGKIAYDHSQLTSSNPHNVTKSQVGLSNVDNTSDLNKPISTATQNALDDKADDLDLTNHIDDTNNPHVVNKSDVGLGNVPNTDFTSDVNANTAKRSYPLVDENKLTGIEAGAQVNVKTDWAETDPNSDKFLENKPTKLSDFTNDGFATETWVNNQGFLTEQTDSQTLSWSGSTGALSISNGNSVDLDGRYLQSFTETDPTVPSHVKSITTTEKSNWNTAYGWGDHSIEGYLTSVSWSDIIGTQSDINLSGFNDDLTYDNYQFWNLKTNGVQRTTIQSGDGLDLVAGNNTTLQYGAGGKVTINSSFNDTTYTAGTGLDLTGTKFSFDTSWGDGRYLQSFTETDPTVPSHVKAITIDDISDWDGKAELSDIKDGTLTLSTGTGLTGSDTFSSNQGTNTTFTVGLSTATQNSLSKADSAFSWGNWNNAGLASETYVDTEIANLVDSSPSALDTLNELAAALGDDPNFATTVSTQIGLKADKSTSISAGTGLTGGGTLSSDRTISLNSTSQTHLSRGNTAYGWGDHSQEGYATETWVNNQGFLTEQTDSQTLSWNGGTGALSISNGNSVDLDGRYSLSGQLPKSLAIGDCRSSSDFPNTDGTVTYMPTPLDSTWSKALTGIFSRDWGGSVWGSVLTVKAYTGTHGSWQISGPSHTGNSPDDYYLRTSNASTDTWNPHVRIWHSGDFDIADYATTSSLPTVNNGTLTLSTGTGLTGSDTFSSNQGTNTTFTVGLSTATQNSLSKADSALQSETDPIFTASPAHGISNTDITNWNEKGVQLTADQPNANIHLKDSAGNIISTLNVGFLNNEGTTILFNSTTDEIELKNDDGDVLSSFPASALMTGVGFGLNLTGSTLELLDSANNVIDSVTLTIANVQGLQTALDNKVDKITGKGLSTNDYTTAEKNKLSGIEAGAEVNVKTDWNATTGDAELLNKPTEFPPSAHTHVISNVTGLQTALDGKALETTQITAGTGLTGGGNLSSNRTIGLSTSTQSDIADGVTAYDNIISNITPSFRGNLTVSKPNSSNYTRKIKSISVIDTRSGWDNTDGSTGYMPKPNDSNLDKSLTGTFSYDWGDSSWGSVLTMKGWNSSYAAWQISGTAGTSTKNDFYLRSGIGETWDSWNRIWHSGDFDSTDISNWNTAYGWGDHSLEGYATENYVDTQVASIVDSAPGTLDTLNELAAALGDDPNFATTVSTQIGLKADKSTSILAGTGLSGGGTLAANRTLSINSSTVSKINNGDTAYGWGNHASAGYLTSLPTHSHSWSSITNKPSTFTPSSHEHEYIKSATSDLNSIVDEKGRLTYESFSSSANGQSFATNNANGVITMTSHVGPYGKQIAFNNTDDLYMRMFNNGTFGSWIKLWHSADFDSTDVSNWNEASNTHYFTVDLMNYHETTFYLSVDNVKLTTITAVKNPIQANTYINGSIVATNGNITNTSTLNIGSTIKVVSSDPCVVKLEFKTV